MKYRDLRDFLALLEQRKALLKVKESVATELEMTWLSDRTLRAEGPALLFQSPTIQGRLSPIPVVTNLFGTPERVALGMGAEHVSSLREIGELLARLKEPEPPRGLKDAGHLLRMAKTVWDMKPALVRHPACHEIIISGDEIDLGKLPVQHCWPGRCGPFDHLGVGGNPRSAVGSEAPQAPEPWHLPTAGDRASPDHHAVVGPPGVCVGLS